MQVINWLELQPLLADVDALNARLQEAQPVRSVCRALAEITLQGYPWAGRSDLISVYHPSRTYQPGQWIALPVPDSQKGRLTAWQVAQVRSVELTGNAVQGRFQALVLDVSGREVQRTAALPGAGYPELELSGFASDELEYLADRVVDAYADALLATLKRLIRKGRVFGQLAGEMFLPEHMFALSLERLEPFFTQLSAARRWVSLEEILQGLPDLSDLKHDTARALIRSSLKMSPYPFLGGDRWTTPELFDQMDRAVPYGLPAAGLHSHMRFWTGQDKKDLDSVSRKPIPPEVDCALDELGFGDARSEPGSSTWQPPTGLLRLPALSTFHIAQACIPVGHLLYAFAPDARMVFVQFMEGELQPFFLDRERGLLKALHPEVLQTQVLEEGLPAGTYLWLEYQGGERYRIFPQPLAAPRRVPCIRASLEAGKLQIEPSQIQVKYESRASVFKVDLLPEEIRGLQSRASRNHLHLRDVLVSTIQELCAVDARRVASRSDIFDAVFLKRPCSPQAVAVLLYSLPGIVQLKGECFRYMNQAPAINVWKGANRVSRLWEDLASDCVAPDPVEKERTSLYAVPEPEQPLTLDFAATQELTPSIAEEEVESALPPLPLEVEAMAMEEKPFFEKVGLESIQLFKHALDALTAPVEAEPAVEITLDDESQGLLSSDESVKQSRVEPFPLKAVYVPVTSMVRVSMEPEAQPVSAIDTRRVAYNLKIPAKPLHKRPIYQRLFFCLRGWFHPPSRRSYDPYSR